MSIRWRNRLSVGAFLFAFFVLGSLSNVTWNEPVGLTGTMVFSSLFMVWTVSIRYRIIDRREKRYFVLLGSSMVLWMVERAVKFSHFLNHEWLERHLWYAYYIPIILMPLLSLMIALCLGKTENERTHEKWKLLYIPALLLIAGILTNDRHQLAFRFNPGFDNWANDYSYGVLYVITLIWIVGCVLISLLLTVRFSSVSGSKKRGFIPLAVILVSLVGVGIYVFTDFRYTRIMNVAELFCFCVIAFWESCLQTGLIPSNTGYDLLFKKTHLSAAIKDSTGKVVYQTSVAKARGVYIPHSKAIAGGEIDWFEDVTVVAEQKKQLEDANMRLSKSAQLLEEENKLKEERTGIAEQKRIYDKMNASFIPQTQRIRRLVAEAQQSEEAWKRNMPLVCVIGALIKRKSNLILLASECETVSLAELGLAFKESLSYLKRIGVTSSMSEIPDIMLPAAKILYAYDELEMLIERKMPNIRHIEIHIVDKEASVLFDIMFDDTPLNYEIEKGVNT